MPHPQGGTLCGVRNAILIIVKYFTIIVQLLIPFSVIHLQHQVLYTDPLCATCRGEEEEGTDSTLTTEESNFSSFVDFVYNDPDWKSLGHFCVQPLQWSFPSAACVTEFAVKSEESPLDKLPNGARKQIFEDCNPRAFLPGKVLQIDTGKERMW